ncbi:uncharacterized protein LOC116742251 [Phocoena sinus]|uniref:uncharacterized protein LOC116742251 n=1 Tax=Phocoena sinus TaxID=42100 RepID=UPI0013C50AB9|nr:uncharacterized protein LOC116742251 [Phocoena sinus]
MSSLFSRGTKSLVRELGRKGELVPVDSLASALRLRPFCLVRKKHRRHLWPWDAPLIPTDFSLVDALKPGSPIPEVSRSEPIHLREMVAGAVTGGVSVGTGLQGSVTGSGVVSHSSALAVQTLRVPPNIWETLVEKRPEDRPAARFERPLSRGALESSPTSSASSPAHTPHPWQETEDSEALVPQGAAEPEGEGGPVCGDKAVEAAQDATLQSLSRGDGAGPLSLLRPSPFKRPSTASPHCDGAGGEAGPHASMLGLRGSRLPHIELLSQHQLWAPALPIPGRAGPSILCGQHVLFSLPVSQLQGQSAMAKEKTVAIPWSTVLAYWELQLVMEDDRWAVLYLPEGELRRDREEARPLAGPQVRSLTSGACRGRLGPSCRTWPRCPQSCGTHCWAPSKSCSRTLGHRRSSRTHWNRPWTLGCWTAGWPCGPHPKHPPGPLRQPVTLERQGHPLHSWSTSRKTEGDGSSLTEDHAALPRPAQFPPSGIFWGRMAPEIPVLSDTQHCLLGQCLERGVLPQRLELSLVGGCELEPQGPGRQLTWDPGMVPQLSALYMSLTGLQLLAAPGPAALQADA